MTCTNCGSTQVETEPSSGASICTNCGTVLEENTIVSEVTFAENAAGGSVLQGQFVSATTGTKPLSMGPGVGGFSRESREVTLQNGRRKIVTIANALHLSTFHVEAAQRLFMLAMQQNFIQGRRTQNVVAACLYIVCRTERTPHMLIDFSDVLETNVFVLGDTYLKFARLLNLRLPIVDPSLYIHRFAAKLEFGDKTHAVALTALRLVARMKRDWMQVGRRPSGICGAGLLIAARLHGFKRTQKEIVHVVKICDVTLRKRLLEFEDTPSGKLTPAEFEAIDLEDEADPPSFTQARRRQKHQQQVSAPAIAAAAAATAAAATTTTAATAATPAESASADNLEELERTGRVLEEALQSEGVDGVTDDAPMAPPPAPTTSTARPTDLPTDSSDSAGTRASAAASAASAASAAAERDTLSDVDDDEIADVLLSQSEVQVKSELWHEINREYLEKQEDKKRLLEEGAIKEPKKKKRRQQRDGAGGTGRGKQPEMADTPAEAVKQVLAQRKISKKINYQVVEELLNMSGEVSFDAPAPVPTKVEPMMMISRPSRAPRPPLIGANSPASAASQSLLQRLNSQ